MKKWINYLSLGLMTMTALVMVIAIGLYCYYDEEDQILDQAVRSDFGGSYINTAMGTTHYQLSGVPTQALVVLVHGFAIPSYLWQPTFDYLTNQGYQVLRYDILGRGLSDRPDIGYAIDDYVTQLHEVVEALNLKQPFHIVGLSMGGPVVTRFVNLYPDSIAKVVLIDPLVKMPLRDGAKWLSMPVLGDFLATVLMVPKIENGLANTVQDPQVFPDWREKFAVQKRFKGFAHAIKSTAVQLSQDDFIEDYRRLGQQQKQIKLFWGQEDQVAPLINSQTLRALIPNIEFHLVKDSGHIPHYEKPDEVNPSILRFLQGG